MFFTQRNFWFVCFSSDPAQDSFYIMLPLYFVAFRFFVLFFFKNLGSNCCLNSSNQQNHKGCGHCCVPLQVAIVDKLRANFL